MPPRLTPEQLATWDRDGYLIVRGLVPADEVAALIAAAMAQAELGPIEGLWDADYTTRFPVRDDPLTRYPRLLQLHRHPHLALGALARQRLLHADVAAITEALLGEPTLAAQSMLYFKPPGARGQALHQDNFYLSVMPGTCLAAWIALDRADAASGGLAVVPGSHRLDLICPEAADMTQSFVADRVPVPAGLVPVQLELDPGDVLFFNGQVIHGSTPNTTADRWRRSLICHYLPARSRAIHDWYFPLLDFSGGEHRLESSSNGGPCGSPVLAAFH